MVGSKRTPISARTRISPANRALGNKLRAGSWSTTGARYGAQRCRRNRWPRPAQLTRRSRSRRRALPRCAVGARFNPSPLAASSPRVSADRPLRLANRIAKPTSMKGMANLRSSKLRLATEPSSQFSMSDSVNGFGAMLSISDMAAARKARKPNAQQNQRDNRLDSDRCGREQRGRSQCTNDRVDRQQIRRAGGETVIQRKRCGQG